MNDKIKFHNIIKKLLLSNFERISYSDFQYENPYNVISKKEFEYIIQYAFNNLQSYSTQKQNMYYHTIDLFIDYQGIKFSLLDIGSTNHIQVIEKSEDFKKYLSKIKLEKF